ncbi:MAG: hypothetical protein J6X18_16695 [Bacteroidales bacterium]|nr:hypothetical protein [Bacteroidales bacterium]
MIRRVVLVDEPVFFGVGALDIRPVLAAEAFLPQLHDIKLIYFLVVIINRFLFVRRLVVGRLILRLCWLYGAFAITTHC